MTEGEAEVAAAAAVEEAAHRIPEEREGREAAGRRLWRSAEGAAAECSMLQREKSASDAPGKWRFG